VPWGSFLDSFFLGGAFLEASFNVDCPLILIGFKAQNPTLLGLKYKAQSHILIDPKYKAHN